MEFMSYAGTEGIALNAGQTQRILLERTIYKNPSCLFLDEVINSLDTSNEKKAVENLNNYSKELLLLLRIF